MGVLNVVSLFSGICGLDEGFRQAGCNMIAHVEQDKACQKVIRRHYPDSVLFDDIRGLTGDRIREATGADVDVLIGGFPCVDVSVAGKRLGLAGQRSGLWAEFDRLIGELEPEWVLIENVPGLLSSWSAVGTPPGEDDPATEWEVEEVSDFATVVDCLLDRGYGVAWRVLDAQNFGVPQRRRRVFFACHRGAPWSRGAEVLLEREGRGGDPASSPEEGTDAAPDLRTGVEAHGLILGDGFQFDVARTVIASPRGQRYDLDTENWVVCRKSTRAQTKDGFETWVEDDTLLAGDHMRSTNRVVELERVDRPSRDELYVRRLTPTEVETLQGFEKGWTAWGRDVDGQRVEIADSPRYKMLGNAVATVCSTWIASRLIAVHATGGHVV